jgi:hypothetical protein
LWWTPVGNKVGTLVELHDEAGLAAELDRIRRTQDNVLLTKAEWRVQLLRGHPGDAVRILLKLRMSHPEEASAVDQRIFGSLVQLGFIDEALVAEDQGQLMSEIRGGTVAASVIDGAYKRPIDFWQDSEGIALNSRVLPNNGRLDEYIRRYRTAFHSPDEFMAAFSTRPWFLLQIAPTVAANLRAGGEAKQADAILRRNEPTMLQLSHNGPPTPDLIWMLAQYRAVDGSSNQAVALIRQAVDGGFLPDGIAFARDIAQEPSFASLVKRPDFQAVRQLIFAKVAEERRKVPLALLAQAYPTATKAAA